MRSISSAAFLLWWPPISVINCFFYLFIVLYWQIHGLAQMSADPHGFYCPWLRGRKSSVMTFAVCVVSAFSCGVLIWLWCHQETSITTVSRHCTSQSVARTTTRRCTGSRGWSKAEKMRSSLHDVSLSVPAKTSVCRSGFCGSQPVFFEKKHAVSFYGQKTEYPSRTKRLSPGRTDLWVLDQTPAKAAGRWMVRRMVCLFTSQHTLIPNDAAWLKWQVVCLWVSQGCSWRLSRRALKMASVLLMMMQLL